MIWALICLATFVPSYPPSDADTLVVCPLEFREAMKPWVAYRQKQGYKIAFLKPTSTGPGLRAQIKQFAESSPLKNVVLVGDAVDVNVPASRLVPTDFLTAKVNVKFGSEPEIATDHFYADLDGDGIVDLNLGRIPVDTVQELTGYIKRVISYESNANQGAWQRRINFIAGVGGFGQMLDKMIEQSVKKIITDLIPSPFNVSMTYGSWRSPYCPDPRKFASTAISKFNEGCLFWIYVGHGSRQRLDRLRLPDRQYEILNNNTAGQMRSTSGPPIAIFLSCYTAAIDAASDGLAEILLKQDQGPIATISSSRISMPYAMGIFSLEMLDGYFDGEVTTLGELVKVSKQKLVEFDASKSQYHQLLHSMGRAFSPTPELLKEERVEHVHLMHLLGDPLIQLKRPNELKLQAPANAAPGQRITVTGNAERAGQLRIDLAYRRDRFRTRPPRRKNYEATQASFSNYQDVYDKVQKLICSSQTVNVPSGEFTVQLKVPGDCSGDCHVRGELKSEGYFALGSSDLTIQQE